MSNHDQALKDYYPTIAAKWDDDIIPQLENYIRIPNKSPMFDAEWKAHGYMDQAMQLIVDWCKQQPVKDMQLKLIEEPGRTPLLYIDIPGQTDDTILLYGHMDKQPEMRGWQEGKGPWQPVIEDGKLYGRGGADDGYAVFASLTAIASLQALNIPHGRCVIVIEASEESGSMDLPHYLEKLKQEIGSPTFVICLDSGCGNYEQLWGTTSLRGLVGGELSIEVLRNGIHSGQGSGVVPSVFHILRQLLHRIEDTETGKITIESLQPSIPQQRIDQAQQAAEIIGERFFKGYSWVDKTEPVADDVATLILNRTWHPSLTVTGIEGLPSIQDAGNVTLPKVTAKLSFRTPPTCDTKKAGEAIKAILEANPPFNAKVTFEFDESGDGWHSPELKPWLAAANDKASQLFFEKPAAYFGEGGSIPFMGMLGEMYPEAQFLIAGVLGPKSNAHGPNEFLHIDMAKKLTGCIASVIASHYARDR